MITTRDANYGDTAALTMLMNELGYPTTHAEMKARFKAIEGHHDYKTILAVNGANVVGMAGLAKGIFYEKNGMYIRIVAFVVKQNHRRPGIGEALITATENWAAEQGIHTIYINSRNADERKAAYSFYQKMGYVIKSSGFVKQLSYGHL